LNDCIGRSRPGGRKQNFVTQTLVTGGSGFIGQHLVAALLAQGCRVRVLDLRPPSYASAGAQYVKGSILDAELVHKALDDVAEVYHLAALPGMWTRCKNDFHAVNYRGTEIMLEAARQRGVLRFLHCSTESILFGSSPLEWFGIDHVGTTSDEMPGVYTRSKLAAEQRALQAAASGFPVVIANPTMPIGPHYGNLTPPTLMLRHFIDRRIQLYFDFILNLVDVRDVAAGLLQTMQRGQTGHRYILGGEAISLSNVLSAIEAITGRKALRVPIPAGIARTTAAVMEFVSDHVTHRAPAGTVEGVRIALRSQPLSIEKSRRDLGYAPNPIGPALRETVASFLRKPGKFDHLADPDR
jgi:dihydroflavonol-4-reductase